MEKGREGNEAQRNGEREGGRPSGMGKGREGG